jgi:hypothetical protein
VGGTEFEISSSLLEQHPNTLLARRLTSRILPALPPGLPPLTYDNPVVADETIFSERSDRQFEYVLDFMRDGKVTLPAGGGQGGGVTKASILEELRYYGFTGVDPDSIQMECDTPAPVPVPPSDAPQYSHSIAQFVEDFENESRTLIAQRNQLNRDIARITVVHAVRVRRMGRSGKGRIEFCIAERQPSSVGRLVFKPRTKATRLDYQVVNAVKEATSIRKKTDSLNAALSPYGILISNFEAHHDSIQHTNGSSTNELYKVVIHAHSINGDE